jgi:hypothetical protein
LSKCKICNKETSEKDEYCELHAKAYENIIRKYVVWKKALNIVWDDYLNEILKNPLTGMSAKEVAQQLLSNE